MAGSLSHIVDVETGKYRFDLIENLGDAYEALDECFYLIKAMTGGEKEEINEYCRDLGFPNIKHNMTGNPNESQ